MNINLDFSNMRPVEYQGYAHIVTERILSLGDHTDKETCEYFELLENDLVKQFWFAGIKAFIDNKCVFVLESSQGQRICVGFYDWTISVGFGYRRI